MPVNRVESTGSLGDIILVRNLERNHLLSLQLSTPVLKDKMSSAKAVVQGLRESFNSGRIRSAACRRVALNQLLEMLETEEEAISTALAKDLRKPEFESVLMELDMVSSFFLHKCTVDFHIY